MVSLFMSIEIPATATNAATSAIAIRSSANTSRRRNGTKMSSRMTAAATTRFRCGMLLMAGTECLAPFAREAQGRVGCRPSSPIVCHEQTLGSIVHGRLPHHGEVSYSSRRNLRSRGGGRLAVARLTAQDRVEAHPAQVMAARLVIAYRDATDVATQNRPDSADHGMAS